MIGPILGHYRVEERIGAGGMGEVYRAHDDQLDRDVALKVLAAGLLSDETARMRFHKEALALARLNHPNIGTIHEFGTQNGVDFLVMELVLGPTLKDSLRSGPMSEVDILRIGIELADALACAHEHGIVHRDLKPGNVIVLPSGHSKLLDFGLAKLWLPTGNGATTKTSLKTDIAGTLPYMAPEQLTDDRLDARIDVYSAGAVLYEMATGLRPFADTESPRLIEAILHRPLTSARMHNPMISPALDSVIVRALDRDPQRRYQSARELRIALESVASPASPAAIPAHVPSWSDSTKFRAFARRWRTLLISTMGLFAIAGAAWFFHTQFKNALTETNTVVLADISNSTGDSVFDETLKQALLVELAQSPFLNILSDQRMKETLLQMGRTSTARVDSETALEICKRTASPIFFSGSISILGSQYVIGLGATSCRTGDALAHEQIQARRKEDVLRALDQAVTRLRKKLGESFITIQKFDTPIEQATTPSLEALKAYSLGMKLREEQGDAEAIPLLHHAIELDSNFAMAYAQLGLSYGNLGEPGLASLNISKAFSLRNRVSEREKFRISSAHYGYVTGELDHEMQTYDLWAQSYPGDAVPEVDLSADYGYLGQYERAVKPAANALQLDSTNAVAYENVTGLYLALGRLDDAEAVYKQAQARHLERPTLHAYMYGVSFLRHDTAEMQRHLAWASGKPGAEDLLLSAQSDTEAYYGRLEKARASSQRAFELARRNHQKETAALWKINAALREVEFGNAARAQKQAATALALDSGRDVQVLAALVFARSGELIQSQSMLDDLQQRFPLNTILNRYWLPTIRATIQISRGKPGNAVASLEVVGPHELGEPPPLAEVGGFLYPVYVRGQAYALSGRAQEAALEFQKILDHPSIIVNCPLGALAHLQLGRAYGQMGEHRKARAAYDDFFNLWKDADPEIPILKAARLEYARLP